MIDKAQVLRQMQETTANGLRREFAIGVITAQREVWFERKRLLAKLNELDAGTDEFVQLSKKIDALDLGGRFIEHDTCILSGPRGMHVNSHLTPSPSPRGEGSNSRSNGDGRNIRTVKPNHSSNRTRNIVFLPGNHIRKIHNSLVFLFNGQEVMY